MNLNVVTDFIHELAYQSFELVELIGGGWYGMGIFNAFWIVVGFVMFVYWTKKLGQYQKEEGIY
jgi:uncharacterized membrane protein